jgi:hypothetical protein
MSYTRHSFTDYKTVIDAKLLGEMDVGIEDAHNNLDGITVSLEGTREENGRKIEAYKMTLPNGKTFDFELKDGRISFEKDGTFYYFTNFRLTDISK